jgi:glycosyltransferase involved in cell wall biosynthesis
MAAAPRVTVLMTLYNKGPWVGESVRSVLTQSFPDLELLVVDDASTDDGPGLVLAFEDPRVRFLPAEKNTGRAASANRGFDNARGEFVAVLDADDVMLPDRLAAQVALMDAHPEVGACGTLVRTLEDGSLVGEWPADDVTCRARSLFGDPVLYGAAMFRRGLLDQHGIRCDEHWRLPGMDYLFLLKMVGRLSFANIQEAHTLYRVGVQNMRHGRDPHEDRKRLYREFFERNGIPVTDRELDLQMMFHGHFQTPPDRHVVQQLHQWKKRLLSLSGTSPYFPQGVFDRMVEKRWDKLFHQLADRSVGAGVAHLRLSHKVPFQRAYYLCTKVIGR